MKFSSQPAGQQYSQPAWELALLPESSLTVLLLALASSRSCFSPGFVLDRDSDQPCNSGNWPGVPLPSTEPGLLGDLGDQRLTSFLALSGLTAISAGVLESVVSRPV